jgi:hypothetical protein
MVGLIAALSMLYVGDWAVWRMRVAHGGGMDTVSVTNMTSVPLKNGRDEYFWDGTADADCSRSIFPQAGSGACWWLRRHSVVYNQ